MLKTVRLLRTMASLVIWIFLFAQLLIGCAAQGATQKNVLDGALEVASTDPMTGFFRDGYCADSPMDRGDHSLAGVATKEFLEFSAAQGNDLRSVVKPGCTWCFCISRWLEAYNHEKGNVESKIIPRVNMAATNSKVLNQISLTELRKFSTDTGKTEL